MAELGGIIANGRRVEAHRPWPRIVVSTEAWLSAIDALAAGEWSLLSLWGERNAVHMAVFQNAKLAVFSLHCPEGTYPSVGRRHPPAIRLERTIKDLFGLRADGALDDRPWPDHGRWGVRHPLGDRTEAGDGGTPYPFLAVNGEGLHQIPVGPVHAGIIEPGHFRFTANGETIVRLEERLGYVHKGIDGLMVGASLDVAARIAARTSGDSTVAYGFAFARAAEAAAGVEAPRRAQWLRGLMAELERLANHFGDIGAICNDASFVLMHAHCGILRERVLRFGSQAFGHRLMMDRIVPGGVAIDLSRAAATELRALVGELRANFAPLVELYDNTASLQDRTVRTGVLSPALAEQFAAGGYVGRASGRPFDARRQISYAPYDKVGFGVPLLGEGDVNARVWIRIREVEQSLALLERLADLPDGPIQLEFPRATGEGMALVEGFRGDVLAWIRLGEDGTVERCHLRDPSWFQWPLLEAVIEGNIVADFPLCNKSFNCSYSGHDL